MRARLFHELLHQSARQARGVCISSTTLEALQPKTPSFMGMTASLQHDLPNESSETDGRINRRRNSQ
jgi:hypothetical protein